MSDQSSDEHDAASPETKIRVSFVLAPSIRSQREALELPTAPIAVPASLRKQGLSAVVNHLLGRRAPHEGASDDDSDDEGDQLPVLPFDFLLNDKLLRLPLDAAARKEGLSTEHALELQYFPARPPPKREGESERLPEWITAMAHRRGGDAAGGGAAGAVLFTGGADGVLRAFAAADGGGALRPTSAVAAHTGPIKCLAASARGVGTLVATGSTDQTLVTHVHRPADAALDLHAVYSGGHTNSLSSVALVDAGGGKVLLASGDWDGGLAVWSVPAPDGGATAAADDAAAESAAKKRKGGRAPNPGRVPEATPLRAVRAHASSVSGLAWGHGGTTLLTGSWDHGLKVYDAARLDCTLTLNGSRVVTALARCSNSDVVATAAPDCTVRLWDMRTNGEGGGGLAGGGGKTDQSLRQSHKAWVSAVQWSPTDPFVLASTSHDGTLKVWDIRSSLPLHTVRAVNKKGEKALCLAFGDGVIYSGGSDCVVKQFTCGA